LETQFIRNNKIALWDVVSSMCYIGIHVYIAHLYHIETQLYYVFGASTMIPGSHVHLQCLAVSEK